MTNSQMIANRFLRWHKARRGLAAILETLRTGGVVQIVTYLRITKCDARHVPMFKAARTGLYIQRGKRWVCIDYCKIVHRR